MRAEFGRGRSQSALEVIDDALTHVTGSRRVGRLLFYRAQILTELGRYDETEVTLEEVLRLARYDGGGLLVPFVAWQRMVMASQRGDSSGTLDHAAEVETHRGDWWAPAGAHFMAEAADCLDRTGCTVEAWHYLERAQAAEPSGAERIIAMAECALLGRHGDPELAEEKLLQVHRNGIYPRERWRVLLLRAYSAWRRGDRSAGPLAAAAFQETARLGKPQLPLIREPELTSSLLDLAAESGSMAAVALQIASHPVVLTLFGSFEICRGGRPVPLGSGQAAQLIKMVAVAGGRLQAEQAIEALWPEVEPAVGRNRLRTVVRSDLEEFNRDARRALALERGDPLAAVSVARSALARYRGDLLMDDLYEPWAEAERTAARRTMVDLADLCSRAAAERGDLDEARRLVERAMLSDPYEPDHYLAVARILARRGQHGGALSVLRRAGEVLAPLGIDVPSEVSPDVWLPGG
jgi:DNA-binding SARP family transcriptional activator